MAALALAHISWAIADNADRPACDEWVIDLFGAETAFEMLVTPETEKYRFDREERLMVVGDTMLIPIAPAGQGAEPGNPLGDMLRRSAGPNRWIGLSLRTADLKAAAAWFTARGFKLHFDPGMEEIYFLIAKWQALGVRIEVMQGELPNDPRVRPDWQPQRWADEHPLGIEGLLSIDVSVPGLEAAHTCFGDGFAWPLLSERDLPGESARGAGFLAGDVVIEALCPTSDDSYLAAHLRDHPGMCGMTFKVRSAAAAAEFLKKRGYDLIGSIETRFAIPPEQAQGRLIWFSENLPEGWPVPQSHIARPEVFPGVKEQV